MVNRQMIAILVCPACHGKLEFDEAASRLNCVPCALSYPVIDGIPVMLIDRAQPLLARQE